MGLIRPLLLVGAGVYIGLVIAKHYEIPFEVRDPKEAYDRIQQYLEKLKKTDND